MFRPTRRALLIPCLSLALAAAAHAQGGTEDRPVAAFTKLRVQNGIDVDLEVSGRRLEFSLSGGSDLDLTAEVEALTISASGGSDASLSGRADALEVSASGGSDVLARSLQSARVRLTVSGGSDASVHADAAIEIHANGGSDVIVFGNPAERDVHDDRSSDVAWR